MDWYDIRDPDDPQLDALALKYRLHPLHIEDCRHRRQNAKIEFLEGYIFVVLKPVRMAEDECLLNPTDLDVFVGADYVITVQEESCPMASQLLDRLRPSAGKLRPGELLHRIFDGIVDAYIPLTDKLSEHIGLLETEALESPQSTTMERLFDVRRALIELRRILANSRDVLGHILRTEDSRLGPALQPFFRDVYDHVTRNLDGIEIQRDLVTGATELYLSSVANQTNQVMKVLTVFGTVATPAIIITGIYGMNVKHLPFAESPHSWGIVMTLIAIVSGLVLAVLRKLRWL
jgi:magnesium transporter